MKVVLTETEMKEYFLNALCNGLDYISSYGLCLEYSEREYKAAKESINKENASSCFEDVLLRMLVLGYKLTLLDEEDEDNVNAIKLTDVYERFPNVPLRNLTNIIEGNDDAEDADVVLQTIFLNEIIYG